MPEYHNLDNWARFGKVTITPRPFIRSLPGFKQFLPYYVGDRVRFQVRLTLPRLEMIPDVFRYVIHERFGGDELWLCDGPLNSLPEEIAGSTILHAGRVEYLFGGLPEGAVENTRAVPIITANVGRFDTVTAKWLWFTAACMAGALLILLFGILPAWTEITAAWNSWMP